MALANPVPMSIPADQWTPAATAIQRGTVEIHQQYTGVLYYRTYVKAGDPAPSNLILPGDDDFLGVPIYNRQDRIAGQTVYVGGLLIDELEDVDIYLWAVAGDGRVIVARSI